MPAKVHVTGPVLHYVVVPGYSVSQALWLGTSKFPPKVRIRRAYKPVPNDLAGQLLPFERLAQGQECQIVTQLNYYVEQVYQYLSATPRFGASPAFARGTEGPLDTGLKVQGNGASFQLILVFPYAGTVNSPAGDGMPAVYRFPVCVSEQDDFEGLGTDAREVMLAVTAQRAFSNYNSGQSFAGGFQTYANDLGGIVLPNPD